MAASRGSGKNFLVPLFVLGGLLFTLSSQQAKTATQCGNITYVAEVTLNCTETSWFHVIRELLYSRAVNCTPDDLARVTVRDSVERGFIADCSGPQHNLPSTICQEKVVVDRLTTEEMATVEYECIDESRIHNMCDDKQVTSLDPLYIATPSLFNTASTDSTCTCHVTGTSLELRMLMTSYLTQGSLTWTSERDNVTIENPAGVAYNKEMVNCSDVDVNDTSDTSCSVDVSFQGSAQEKIWIEVISTGNLTLQCNDYAQTTLSTSNPTGGSSTDTQTCSCGVQAQDTAGLVVGGFFGGAAFVVIAAIIFYFIFRWYRSRSSSSIIKHTKPRIFKRPRKSDKSDKTAPVSFRTSASADSTAASSQNYSGMEVNRSDSHKYGSLSLSLSPGINLDEDKQETARESKQIGKCDSDMYLVPVEMRQEKEGEQANRASDMYMPMEIEHRGQDERRSKPLSAFGSDEGQHQQEKKQRPQPPPLPSEPPPGDHNPAHQKHEQQQLQKEPSDSQLYVPMDNGEEVAEPEVYYGNQPQSRQSTESRAGFFVGDESKKADDEEGEIYANEDEGEEYVEVSETPSAGRRPPEGAAADDVEEANIYDDTGDDNLYENPEK